MNGRAAEIPLDLAWAAQAIVSAAAVAAVIWAYRRPRDPLLSLALLVTATFAATPYIFNYDMVVFGWLFAKLLERQDNNAWDYALMFLVWTLPAATIVLGLLAIPGSALAAFAGRLTWRLHGAARCPPMPAETVQAARPL